ncbi:MAG: AAA family ATPase, partial [Pseudomonadota bacterium]|nr:AAA family ATPase [Pseudomonadota bacterium]
MPAPTPHDERNGDPVLDAQENLVCALQHPLVYDHPLGRITVLETHISWVILTGEYAYKIKKAVNFGFLDFSTLEKRHFYCQEELRLNRRFAAGLYLDVVAITGSLEQPSLNGAGDALEYAVRMRQFPQEDLLSSIASHKALTPSCVDDMIELVAGMHFSVSHAGEDTDFGVPADIHHWVVENFEHIRPALTDSLHREQLDRLERWCQEEYQDRKSLFQTRKQAGFVRECHGDLHLGNLALINGRITPFDCIEFNPRLRWIDIMSEAAFLMMDMEDRGYSGLAYRFLNGYLQRTGDYDGVRLLRYYLVYRALVRAKVAVLRLVQADLEPAGETDAWKEFESYMRLARQYAENRRPAVIITHGVSGSGKSWWAAQLAERLGAIRIRSDVERKRLFGYKVDADTRSGIQTGIYSSPAS